MRRKVQLPCTCSWGALALLLLVALLAPTPAGAVLQCVNDIQGPSDIPGQKDLTRWCVDFGTPPYELVAKWNWDEIGLSGKNTADACVLFDTNGNGNADIAVCVTWDTNQRQVSGSPRFFACGDGRPDNCTNQSQQINQCSNSGSQPIGCMTNADCTGGATCQRVFFNTPGVNFTFNTTCSVANAVDDPFPTDANYPNDTAALCFIDLNDFNVTTGTTVLIDTCSYPSSSPTSSASDCVVTKACTTSAECNDSNQCTSDTCDTTLNLCRHTPTTGASCDDGLFCTVNDKCSSLGFCSINSPRDCSAANTVCATGVCDETLDACIATAFKPATTVCRPSAGVCDLEEHCTGTSATCPPDAKSTDVCRPSAGVCDVAESCDGVNNNCPADTFASSAMVCRPSAGQCDVAETCTGTSAACPPDSFASAATSCTGTSQGGACDGADHCSGTSNTCVDVFLSSSTVCRPSAGQCDVEEKCTGSSGACPADSFAPATTVCTGTSQGGACDDVDHCLGTANTCIDGFKASTVVCRPSAGQCDVAENCTGTSGACPADKFASVTTPCTGTSQGGACDGADHCLGTANTCVDVFLPSSTVCRPSAGVCDVAENCTGSSGACPTDAFKSSSTVCRPAAGVCDAAENCTGDSAACPADVFQACASVTDSSLCQFDTDTTQCNGAPGGRVFNALFMPDVQLWPAYKQNATNPGQFYYNLVYQGTEGQTYTINITIPWPFITVGGVPVHVYDAKDVTIGKGTNGLTCFTPPGTAIATSTQQITLADWANGTNNGVLVCNQVTGPAGSGFCTFPVSVTIPLNNLDVDSIGQVYVNVHLDYGFKGTNVNANPVDGLADRYDQGTQDTANGGAGYDALMNSNTTVSGPLAIDNCTDYKFSHTDGTQPVQSDDVFNLNLFKKISGAFGQVKHSIDGSPGLKGVQTQLINSAKTVVATGTTDQDGFYTLVYKHTGKAAQYIVKLGAPYNQSLTVTLKANGWSEADFDIDTGIGFTDTGCGSGATTCQ